MSDTEVVCTITSPGYWSGTGVLINSLHRAGFRGRFVIGHRGSREGWALSAEYYEKTIGIKIDFVEIFFDGHLFYFKPEFMMSLFKDSNIQRLYFFDSDIVVNADWEFFGGWAAESVALCQDVCFVGMEPGHPLKQEWSIILDRQGYLTRPVTGYVNAGFIGLHRDHLVLLEIWRNLMRLVPELQGDYHSPLQGPIWTPFIASDQDFLNMAIMGSTMPISMAGSEGMGFAPGQCYMAHAIGTNKPWDARVIRDVIVRGKRPSLATRAFWDTVAFPIPVYSINQQKTMQIAIRIAAGLGRVLAR